MLAIGRHRKLIMNKFLNLDQRKIKVTVQAAKEIIGDILDHCKLKVEDKNWPILLGFASRKDGTIDFKLLMNIYKDRVNKIMTAPKAKILYI